MNKPLIKTLIKLFETSPERLDMGRFFSNRTCRTTACIAGWAILLEKPKEGKKLAKAYKNRGFGLGESPANSTIEKIQDTARELLGINEKQSLHLFFASHWPKKFKAKYFSLGGISTADRAKTTVARLRHFLKTGR